MPESYAANAASGRIGLGTVHTEVRHDSPDLVVLREVPLDRFRIVARRPLRRLPAAAAGYLAAAAGIVEDPFGTLPAPGSAGVATVRMPVMARPPGAVPPPPCKADLEVTRVTDRAGLEAAEQVIAYGFPRLLPWPCAPGRLLPPHAPTVAGLRVWLARRQGVPAAACCTYDDGATVGLHALAVLPEQRGRGIARLLAARALADHADRRAVLATTEAGAPLFRSLGFTEVSQARWHLWG
ncbi:GNAT family N-acetyltransferase [Thermobifida cellulosilytica]|uniref:GNAT family N-acetyltransferase n=1 Tax=Thermobifida cellulosilytica TaxID=144786 RepID=UPI0008399D07|nr:GNAT family N-acetyltransferase [Thermobifida cellulosilytica]